MTNHKVDFSPLAYARIAGALYLVIIAGGIFAEMFVRQRLFIANDAAATAANILSHEQLYRWGFVAQLVPLLCNMFLAVIFYSIFAIVHRRLALTVAFCSLVGSAVEASSLLAHFAPLTLLKRGAALGVDAQLLQAQAFMAFQLQAVGFSVALTFSNKRRRPWRPAGGALVVSLRSPAKQVRSPRTPPSDQQSE